MARPLVIAHRGASALRPEHTLAAYERAIRDGADAIEPDLVITRDGVLVARHENAIGATTDVATRPAFASRRTGKTVDGLCREDWFVEDLTLAELKRLRAVERLGAARPESRRCDGAFEIATFEEIVALAADWSRRLGRGIGLVPEIKHSTYFTGLGLPIEQRLLDAVARAPHLRTAPLEIQSFEVANLRRLRGAMGRPANLTLMQLIGDPCARPADAVATGTGPSYAQMTTPEGLAEIAHYADVLAPSTRAVIPLDADGRLARPTVLVADAHAAGLLVRPWTFRPENRFLAADFRDDAGEDARNPAGSVAEMRAYCAAGIDGFFTDDPALGRHAVDADA